MTLHRARRNSASSTTAVLRVLLAIVVARRSRLPCTHTFPPDQTAGQAPGLATLRGRSRCSRSPSARICRCAQPLNRWGRGEDSKKSMARLESRWSVHLRLTGRTLNLPPQPPRTSSRTLHRRRPQHPMRDRHRRTMLRGSRTRGEPAPGPPQRRLGRSTEHTRQGFREHLNRQRTVRRRRATCWRLAESKVSPCEVTAAGPKGASAAACR